jgi:hypothetical protein
MSSNWTQRNESQKDVPQHAQKSNPVVKNKKTSSQMIQESELKN